MYMHCAAYSASLAAGPNLDTTAAQDDVLGRRNSHLIVTEPYTLLAAQPIGALLTRARFANAALSQLSINHLWPLTVSATQPTNPIILDYRDSPLLLPQNEELTLELSNSAAGPTVSSVILMLGAEGWTENLPSFVDKLSVRATTVAAAGTTTTWNALSPIVFEKDLLNGVYAVTGCTMVAAGALAFRMRFPDQPNVNGRQHRPGFLVQQTAATQPNPMFRNGFGEWGRFHTFTPPEFQVFGDAAGGTYEVRLDMLYLGRNEALLRR